MKLATGVLQLVFRAKRQEPSLLIRTPVRLMARPQFVRDPDPTRDLPAVKAAVKHLGQPDRANLLAWLLIYFDDQGEVLNPLISRRRKRIRVDDAEFWLVIVPKLK
jgi:hypothetical protein